MACIIDRDGELRIGDNFVDCVSLNSTNKVGAHGTVTIRYPSGLVTCRKWVSRFNCADSEHVLRIAAKADRVSVAGLVSQAGL